MINAPRDFPNIMHGENNSEFYISIVTSNWHNCSQYSHNYARGIPPRATVLNCCQAGCIPHVVPLQDSTYTGWGKLFACVLITCHQSTNRWHCWPVRVHRLMWSSQPDVTKKASFTVGSHFAGLQHEIKAIVHIAQGCIISISLSRFRPSAAIRSVVGRSVSCQSAPGNHLIIIKCIVCLGRCLSCFLDYQLFSSCKLRYSWMF